MERRNPEIGTPKILSIYGRVGHVSLIRMVGLVCLGFCFGSARVSWAQGQSDANGTPSSATSSHWWLFASGFVSSILAHEGAHIVAAYAVGGRPSFGLDTGRPTIYSGVDATLQPRKQFVFSSAGLTVQSLIDEGILDRPHRSARASAFERGMLAGGIATSFFYVTIGRTGSVSDVDYMARTSNLSKTSITAIYGGLALLHTWRISRDSRYADFFARPDPYGGLRVGLSLDR